MKDAAEEQLRDGRIAAETAASVESCRRTHESAVEASKLQDAAAASTAAGDASGGQDTDQAKALVAAGEEKSAVPQGSGRGA